MSARVVRPVDLTHVTSVLLQQADSAERRWRETHRPEDGAYADAYRAALRDVAFACRLGEITHDAVKHEVPS